MKKNQLLLFEWAKNQNYIFNTAKLFSAFRSQLLQGRELNHNDSSSFAFSEWFSLTGWTSASIPSLMLFSTPTLSSLCPTCKSLDLHSCLTTKDLHWPLTTSSSLRDFFVFWKFWNVQILLSFHQNIWKNPTPCTACARYKRFGQKNQKLRG